MVFHIPREHEKWSTGWTKGWKNMDLSAIQGHMKETQIHIIEIAEGEESLKIFK